jgi:hypothetical protein
MEDRLHTATAELSRELHARLRVLSRRATLINRAMALCVLSGLLVSLVVAALFVSASLRIDLALPIAIAFVIALLSLAAALLLFLREVFADVWRSALACFWRRLQTMTVTPKSVRSGHSTAFGPIP